MSRRRGIGPASIAVALAALVSGCATSASPPAPSPSPVASAAPVLAGLGAPGCSPASPAAVHAGIPEVQGTPRDDATLFMLVMTADPLPLHVSSEPAKLVARMTGSGDLRVTVIGPDGAERPRAFGPQPHSESTYDRPGDEWGVGAVLDEPGCWQLTFERANEGAADLYLTVLP